MKYFFAIRRPVLVGTATLALSLASHAALTAVDLDGNAINGHEGVYDDVLDITWLADANIALTNTFGVTGIYTDGAMGWNEAEAFVTAMNTFDSGNGYFGIDTWRQPTLSPVNGSEFYMVQTYDGSTDDGFQISAPVDATYNPNGQSPGFTGSEMAYHYYNNFQAIGGCYGPGTTVTACQSPSVRGIDDAPDPNNYRALFSGVQEDYWNNIVLDSLGPFFFVTAQGNQENDGIFDVGRHVWAVADGNVAAANAVPVPAAVWLFGSGLLGLLGIRKFNKDV